MCRSDFKAADWKKKVSPEEDGVAFGFLRLKIVG